MNNFKVEIRDKSGKYVDFTRNAVFPLKIANMLDERLDEAELMLKRVDKEYFLPFTIVKLTLTNHPEARYASKDEIVNRADNVVQINITYNSTTKRIKETQEIYMFVANDNAIEQPVGSGKYNHQIYLIELTKIMERFIGDSITFTNALGNNYTGE